MTSQPLTILDASSRQSTDFERVHVMDGWVMSNKQPASGYDPAEHGPRHFIGHSPASIDFDKLREYLDHHCMDGTTILQDIESFPLHDGASYQQSHSVMMHKIICHEIHRMRPDLDLTCFAAPVPDGRPFNLKGWAHYKAARFARIVEACEPVVHELNFITVPVYWKTRSHGAAISYAKHALSLVARWRPVMPICALICPRIVTPQFGNTRWQDNPQIADRWMRRFLDEGVLPYCDKVMVWDSPASPDWIMGDWGLADG